MSNRPTIFLLGATGFLGSQFLIFLARDLPQFHIVALLRAPDLVKEAQLKAIYKDLSVVEGTLDSDDVIAKQAEEADYTINCASSDHLASVECKCRILIHSRRRLKLIRHTHSNLEGPREKVHRQP